MIRSIPCLAAAVFAISLAFTGAGWADGPKPTVRKSVAKFRTPTRQGAPRDNLIVRGDLSFLGAFAQHDAEADELFAALGPTVFASHRPAADEASEPGRVRVRSKRGRLRYTKRDGRSRVKLTVDLRSGRFELKAKRVDLGELSDTDGEDVSFALGTTDLTVEDRFDYDTRRSDRWTFRWSSAVGGGSPGTDPSDEPDIPDDPEDDLGPGELVPFTAAGSSDNASPSVTTHQVVRNVGAWAGLYESALGIAVRLPADALDGKTGIGLFLGRRPFTSKRTIEIVSVRRYSDGSGRVFWREVDLPGRWNCMTTGSGSSSCPDRYPAAIYTVPAIDGPIDFEELPMRDATN